MTAPVVRLDVRGPVVEVVDVIVAVGRVEVEVVQPVDNDVNVVVVDGPSPLRSHSVSVSGVRIKITASAASPWCPVSTQFHNVKS